MVANVRDWRTLVLLDELADLVGCERQTRGEKIEVHHADGVKVGASARGNAVEEFGGHVRRRAGDRDSRAIAVVHAADQSEIGELGPAVFVNQDVGGLDVAVNESRVVRRADGQHDLPDERRGAHRIERAVANDRLAKAHPAGDVFHLDIMQPAIAAQVMDRDDVRVDEIRDSPRLGPESLSELRLPFNEPRVDHFDCAVSMQTQV